MAATNIRLFIYVFLFLLCVSTWGYLIINVSFENMEKDYGVFIIVSFLNFASLLSMWILALIPEIRTKGKVSVNPRKGMIVYRIFMLFLLFFIVIREAIVIPYSQFTWYHIFLTLSVAIMVFSAFFEPNVSKRDVFSDLIREIGAKGSSKP